MLVSLYDDIGRTYSGRRQSDPRIAAAIEVALARCDSILNVGAGTGSYEPRSKSIVAVEPSAIMIAQRPAGAAPVVQACAEALPFSNDSFDAVLGILTVRHWRDQDKGFAECRRVARSRVVLLTNDMDVFALLWLFDYLPELLGADRRSFPRLSRLEEAFGPVECSVVHVPDDCHDGFLGAYWQRPRAYLDQTVGNSISTFSKIGNADSALRRLENDISSGEWERRYSHLAALTELDLGYRVVTAQKQRGV